MNIAVLTSGGVDSSVVLHKLWSAGHTVTAFYLKIWLEDELSHLGSCPWEEDLFYVRELCERLSIPLTILPLQREYQEQVVTYTLGEIRAGRTPNPDIRCNEWIKCGAFFSWLDWSKFDKVATGHYAHIRQSESGEYELIQAPDEIKDQTYFLSRLTQKQLARLAFPLGELTKQEVRAYAKEHSLPAQDRKDSQGICFLGKIPFNEFVRHHCGEKAGELIEYETGKVMGIHQGFWFYTIGQRQGIGLAGGPWYVIGKDPVQNRVLISRSYHEPDKERRTVKLRDLHWISGSPSPLSTFEVKLRHGATKIVAQRDNLILTLAENDQGIAPGQVAVLYHHDHCLGSGVIDG